MIGPGDGPGAFEAWSSDRSSGATSLTLAAGRMLSARVASLPLGNPTALAQALRPFGESHPAFGCLWRLLDRIARVAEKALKEGVDAAERAARAGAAIDAFVDDLGKAETQLAREAAALVPEGAAVATLSRSGAVEAALREAHANGVRFRVILSEARPGLEGRAFAEALSREAIPVVYGTDATLPLLASRARVLLIGADAVQPRGFINKAGTWPLLLAAREANVPAYVLAARAKFLSPVPGTLALPLHEPRAVLAEPLPHVDAVNAPLEEVPLNLVRGVVTERGLLTPGEAAHSATDSTLHASLAAPA